MGSIEEQETNYGSFALVAAGPAITIKALFTFFSDEEASDAGELSISQSFRKARPKYVKRYGRRFIGRFLNGFLAHQSLVPHAPIHDNRSYPFLERFVENWPIIHNEVRAILKHREAIPLFQQVWADQSRIARGANWRTFILFGFGQKVGRNCNHAPVTTEFLSLCCRKRADVL